MKLAYTLVIAFTLLTSVELHAATCRMKTDGYGTFIGTGKTESIAFENAAERCFDEMNNLKIRKSKQAADADQQEDFMNYCVNLSCSDS